MTFERRGSKIEALRGVDLHIDAGRFCSILGPSGCGKSTLLMLVAGLYRPSTGRILIGGQPLTGAYGKAGMVFQSDVLLPWLSVLDNVLLPARVKRLPDAWARPRAYDLLARAGLCGFEANFPGELSGGMRQRASLCRALLQEPPLLLMDEPFGALDALTRERMQTDLARISAQDLKTVLFVTHDIEEAVLLSDEVIVMSTRPGRVVQRFSIPFTRPRAPALRRDPEFHRAVDEIRALFEEIGIL
ncbi:MAG: ABC transporter ATP-binding protein [Bradyrhizobiaceae bacterium]|nr:ABC transporter ATP-binding protein [Bradyrhizobiaceae bacterium]